MTTTPDIMFSATDQPTRPVDLDLGAVDEPAAEVAEAALEGDPAAGEDAGAERVLRAGVEDRDVLDALLVEQPAQLEVDLAGGQVARVETARSPSISATFGTVPSSSTRPRAS